MSESVYQRVAAALAKGDVVGLGAICVELAVENVRLSALVADLQAADQTRRALAAERKRTRRALAPDPTPEMRAAVLERDGYRCVRCGGAQESLHLDHIVPVVAGGQTTLENLQTLCAECNWKKGGRVDG